MRSFSEEVFYCKDNLRIIKKLREADLLDQEWLDGVKESCIQYTELLIDTVFELSIELFLIANGTGLTYAKIQEYTPSTIC